MNSVRPLLVLILLAVPACTDDGGPAPGETTTTLEAPITTTTGPGSSTVPSTPGPTTTPGRDLGEVSEHLIDQLPGDWSAPSLNRAPFTITVCGRSVRVVDADPTDESPNRPQEGFILSTNTSDEIAISVTVYEQFESDTLIEVENSLALCGPASQTNPTDGWTLTTDTTGEVATVAAIEGFLITSESTRVYTDSRQTRYSASQLFIGMTGGFLVRVNVSLAGTEPDPLEQVDEMFESIVDMVRQATGG